jgi:hypothetical protein
MTLAIAQIIAEQMILGVAGCKGPIKDLCDLNYASVKRYPKITVSDVDPDEATRNLPLVKDLLASGGIKYRLTAEEQLWRRLGFTLPDSEFDPANPTNQKPDPTPLGPDGLPMQPGVPPQRTNVPSPSGPKGGAPRVAKQGPQNRVEQRGTKLDMREGRQQALRLGIESYLRWPSESDQAATAKGYSRPPTMFESQVCLLGQISATMSNGAAALGAGMLACRSTMIDDLTQRMQDGKVNRRNLSGLRRSKPKGVAPHQQTLKERWMDVAKLGKMQAAGELQRQKALDPTALGLSTNDSGDNHWNQLPPGAMIPPSASVPEWVLSVTESALDAEVEAEGLLGVEIAVDELWARLLDAAINEYMRLSRTGIPEAEVIKQVEALLQGLSSKPELLVGKQMSNVAYNQGRDVAIKIAGAAGEARYAIRSEVLDSNSCDVCPGLDGIMVLIGTPEYEQLLPPSLCEGGDGCRGFYVLISDQLTGATANDSSL